MSGSGQRGKGWETITVDFADIGYISFDKREVKDKGLGRYFKVPVGCFEQ